MESLKAGEIPDELHTERPSDSLPKSPLITHPRLVDPEKYRKHKRRATVEDDVADLRRNPWAQALISPVRMCGLTKTRIPTALLGSWGLVKRKSDERMWLLPIGVLEEELKAGYAEGRVKETKATRAVKMRMVERLPLLERLNPVMAKGGDGHGRSPVLRILPPVWRFPVGPFMGPDEKNVAWRDDTPAFWLRKIRKVTLGKLKVAMDKYIGLEQRNAVWHAVEMNRGAHGEGLIEGLGKLEAFDRMECGGVLVIPPRSNNESASDAQSEPAQEEVGTHTQLPKSAYPDMATLPQTQSKVPVFDLAVLLSQKNCDELKEMHPAFSTGVTFFRPYDRPTVEAMLALWKLKNALRA